jgi:hypothetical protein
LKKLLKILAEFRDKETKDEYCLYNITQSSEAFRNGYRLCQEFVESFGETNQEISFEFLSKMQNFAAFQYLLKVLKNNTASSYKPFILMRLMQLQYLECRYTDKQVKSTLLSNYKMINYLLENKNTFSEIIKVLPQKSAYLIFQINQSMDEIYIGFGKIEADGKKPTYCTFLLL